MNKCEVCDSYQISLGDFFINYNDKIYCELCFIKVLKNIKDKKELEYIMKEMLEFREKIIKRML